MSKTKFLAVIIMVWGMLLVPRFASALEKELIISEVGFKEENDFIELKVLMEGNYGGYGIYEGSVKIAEIPAEWELLKNDLIVLYEDAGINDREKSDSDDKCYELFGTGSLVGTDNVIQIKDPGGNPVDVLIYSNLNDNFTASKTEANYALDLGFWDGTVPFSSLSDESAWTDSDDLSVGQSLNRTGVFDVNSPDDFEIQDVSPGFEVEERYISEKIEISELFPNPFENEEEDEFIELYNPEEVDVDLEGYVVKDNAKSYTITAEDFGSAIIKSKFYFVIERPVSGIALNNTEENIWLTTPAGEEISHQGYLETKEGLSYAKNGNAFFWTKKITKGLKNIIEEEKSDLNGEDKNNETKNSSTNEDIKPTIPKGPYSNNIIISEILPNPSGLETESEFIELYNKGGKEVNLSYWQIDDMAGGSKPYLIPEKTVIGPGQYLVFYNKTTRIALNNNEDSARLLQPDLKATSEAFYKETAKEDYSFSRKDDGAFSWTKKTTPGKKNEFIIDASGGDDIKKAENKAIAENEVPSGPYTKDVVINEVLPNPSESETEEEWIELYNKSDRKVEIAYFWLDDGEKGSKAYLIPKNTFIEARGYLIFKSKETRISLSNSGDMVRLLFPNKEIASQLQYETSAKENVSLARKENGLFGWTQEPTPNAKNSIKEVLGKTVKKKSSSSKKSTSKKVPTRDEIKLSTIAEALKKEKGEYVKVEGVVSVEPGMLSVRYFYFQDNTAGIQVYKTKGDLPEVKISDSVEVFGKISVSQGEKRILISETDDVVVKENNQPLNIEVIKTGDAKKNQLLSKVVRIRAKLLKAEGNVLYFDDGSGKIVVTISKGSGIKSKDFVEGLEYEIVGLLRLKESEIVLSPRFKDDVVLVKNESKEELKGEALEAADNLPFKSSRIWLITGIATLVMALAYGGWYLYQKRFSKNKKST